MTRRTDLVPWVALLLALTVGSSCSSTAKPETAEVGHHRVQFVGPKGWERLDHGRQQLFRLGEAQISLVDMGPGTLEAMVVELRAAESLWRAGRKKDAFQRIRELKSPALRYASHEQRGNFWRPWTDVTYIPDLADSFALGTAFQALIDGVAAFEPVSPERTVDYVLLYTTDTRRREVGHKDSRTIHGADWVDLELWDRVSHMDRARLAFLVNDGYLLVLATDRGIYEEVEPVFEALLTSMEVTPAAPGAR